MTGRRRQASPRDTPFQVPDCLPKPPLGFLERRPPAFSIKESNRGSFSSQVGGGKLSTRIPLLKSLIARQKCDLILLGSMIAVPFLRALGWRTGGTPLERDAEKAATELLELAEKEGVEIVLPTDMVCGDRVAQGARLKICSARHILQGEDVLPKLTYPYVPRTSLCENAHNSRVSLPSLDTIAIAVLLPGVAGRV